MLLAQALTLTTIAFWLLDSQAHNRKEEPSALPSKLPVRLASRMCISRRASEGNLHAAAEKARHPSDHKRVRFSHPLVPTISTANGQTGKQQSLHRARSTQLAGLRVEPCTSPTSSEPRGLLSFLMMIRLIIYTIVSR